MEKEAALEVPEEVAGSELDAIHEVLWAEKAAEEEIVEAKEEASRLLLAAKAKARAIHDVSNRRISAFHARCAQVAASRHGPGEARADRAETLTGEELNVLHDAVAEAARILTGESAPSSKDEGSL